MRPFRIAARPALLASIIALLITAVTAPAAQARVVTREGLRVTAPAGYSLTWANGSYTLRNKNRFVKVTYGRTPLAVRPTANQIARGMKGRLSAVNAPKHGRTLTARITRGKYVYRLKITRKGMVTTVQLYGRRPAKAAKSGASARATSIFGPIVTAGDILALDRVLATRRGTPRVIPFNLAVPTRRFQAPVQNGASALVPNLPGWQYAGTDSGYLKGGHPNQGSFELGGFLLVNYPTFAQPGAIVAVPSTPEAAIAEVLPQHWRRESGGQSVVVVNAVQLIPGSQGTLGLNINSGTYQVRFTFNGRPWQGLFTVGIGDAVSGISWGTYFSFIAVPVNAVGGIAPALMNTWATWSPDAAVQAGLNRAMQTVLTTRVPGAPIDPAVFARTNQMWVDYIRG